MRIHITTIAPEAAAVEIMEHMQARGGEWIVNAVEDEGYVMARVGTLDGKRLERSMSPCLCGPFSAAWSMRVIRKDLKDARDGGKRIKYSKHEHVEQIHFRPGRPPTGAVSAPAMVLKSLSSGAKTARELASELGIKHKSARRAVWVLCQREEVRVVQRRQLTGCLEECVYGVAA